MKLILCYHNFVDDEEDKNGPYAKLYGQSRSITRENLSQQLSWLKQEFDVVGLDEMVQEDRSSRRLAITVDDGFRSMVDHAYPVLKELQVPATWFIASAYVQNSELHPWWFLLDFVREKVSHRFEFAFEGKSIVHDPVSKDSFFSEMRSLFLKLPAPRRNKLQEQLEQAIRQWVDIPQNSFIREDELIHLFKETDLIVPGCHTHQHVNCGIEPKEFIEEELITNQAFIESVYGKKSPFFAFPYGRKDSYRVEQETREALRRASISHAFTTERSYMKKNGDDYFIPRLTMQPNWSIKKMRYFVKNLNQVNFLMKVKRALN
ncbi:MAG: polysaccharide deacetylase family protein [Roseivirga sp.]|nr:polysaccharide deacetylase family protein [Roseivirga sp.]